MWGIVPGPLVLSLSKHPHCALALVLSVLGPSASAQTLPLIDHVVVRKADRTIELYAESRLVHTIDDIQLGRAPLGAKRFEGDRRTPEGRYTIDYGNPESRYYLSLHISYPSAEDSAFAAAQGRSAGGQIFIHGQPNDWPGPDRAPGDWTDGCIAVSDAEMDLLWDAVPDGTPIDILP